MKFPYTTACLPLTRSTLRFGLVLLVAAAFAQARGAEARRPNILFILADDQAPWDLRVYNPVSTLDTPHLDQLAARGMVIDGAYQMGSWTGAVCTASRTMIMTGRSLWHTPRKGANVSPAGNAPAMVPSDVNEHLLPIVFRRAGYATMRTCKVGNSYAPANEAFEVVHDSNCREGDDLRGSAWHAEQVLNYLDHREEVKDQRPFLIYYGFSHPHDPRNGKPGLLAKYGALNFTDESATPALDPNSPPLPPNWLPRHPFDTTHSDVRDETSVSGVWTHRDPATIRNEIGREFACSENIDFQIGRVLDRLAAMGEMENTIIIYTSDHGISIGRHGLMGKQNLYEETLRVPFIVAGPGIKSSRATGNLYLADVLPTLADLANLPPVKTADMLSFKSVLTGERDSIRDVIYGAYAGGRKPGIRVVKQGAWKLIKYQNGPDAPVVTQLFNLAENPWELLPESADPEVVRLTGRQPSALETNLAENPAFAPQREAMEALLQREMMAHDDPYRFSDQP